MASDYRPITTDELVFDIKTGLRRARKFLPRRTDRGSEESLDLAAREIVEHLELAGVRCYRQPLLRLHSVGAGPVDEGSEAGARGE